MPAVQITPADLEPFATIDEDKALEMIEDALGMAELVAPCIVEENFAHPRAAKAVLRGAILRWNDAGQGAVTQTSDAVLGFQHSQTIDTSQPRRAMFWPSEIKQLQDMCRKADESKAFALDTLNTDCMVVHADICTINLGGQYCSCGAVLTQRAPLWEAPWY